MYSWNQLRPCGAAAATSSIDVVPMVDNENGMPAASAAVAPAISPSVCIIRVKPVGAMPNGSADVRPSTCDGRVDLRDVAQDRRVEGDVGERLPGPGQGDLAVRRAVGVVERRAWGAALGDRAQVRDGVAALQPSRASRSASEA